MSLLVDIAAQGLDPGYADAAARRQATGQPPAKARPAVVLAGVLAATLVVVVAAVQAHERAPDLARSRQALVAQVEQRTDTVAGLQTRLDALRRSTERVRTRVLSSSAAGEALSARIAAMELAAGTVAASGPGLRVVLDDAANDERGSQVLDTDLQRVVNALWAAGAEAVAVGEERLTAQSAIRQAGGAVLVNFQAVSPPYVVVALGDPVSLETSFGASRAAARMRAAAQLYGLRFDYTRDDRLDVPPAPGLTLRHAVATTRAASP